MAANCDATAPKLNVGILSSGRMVNYRFPVIDKWLRVPVRWPRCSDLTTCGHCEAGTGRMPHWNDDA